MLSSNRNWMIGTLLIWIVLESFDRTIPENFFKTLLSILLFSFSIDLPSLRSDKISDLLRKEISLIINKETKDPRLQKLNITAVKVSDDIGIATVFYTMIGESIEKEKSSIDNKVLKKFSGDQLSLMRIVF